MLVPAYLSLRLTEPSILVSFHHRKGATCYVLRASVGSFGVSFFASSDCTEITILPAQIANRRRSRADSINLPNVIFSLLDLYSSYYVIKNLASSARWEYARVAILTRIFC